MRSVVEVPKAILFLCSSVINVLLCDIARTRRTCIKCDLLEYCTISTAEDLNSTCMCCRGSELNIYVLNT
uniref:Secreted protein n=1 Tax=Oryza brachyantha TaxID=4533 RepID=J3LEU1_ORYBR